MSTRNSSFQDTLSTPAAGDTGLGTGPAMAAPALTPPARTRPLADNPALAARTVELLLTLRSFVRLNADEARCVLAYMREVSFQRGDVLMRAGDSASAAFMLLLLEGDVAVQANIAGLSDAGPTAVLGPGSVLGEMSLFDGAPRSATCTAVSAVQAAGLARRGLERLVAEHPVVAAKLMAGMAQQMADRLRAVGDQLQVYAQLNDSLRDELDQLRLKLSL
jgi:CRP/FNR family cyclic AMP-dependent transcriptional regulator